MSFIVTEEGVYRHRVAAPFDTLDDAIEWAADWARNDTYWRDDAGPDGYHSYDIYKVEAGSPGDLERLGGAWRGTVRYERPPLSQRPPRVGRLCFWTDVDKPVLDRVIDPAPEVDDSTSLPVDAKGGES